MNEPISLAVIESPYSAPTLGLFARNVRYARAAVRDAIQLGYAPLASHLLYTQPSVLDEADADQRARGILLGHFPYTLLVSPYLRSRDTMETRTTGLVYAELGVTAGMKAGIQTAKLCGCPVLHRTLERADLLATPTDEEAVRILTEPLSLPRNVKVPK